MRVTPSVVVSRLWSFCGSWSLLNRGVRYDAVPQSGDRGPCCCRKRRVASGLADLVKQVDELLDGPDEIARGHVVVKQPLERLVRCPLVRPSGEARVWRPEERQLVLLLDAVKLAPEPCHGPQDPPYLAAGQAWQLGVLDPARLEGESGNAGSELGLVEVAPYSAAHALCREQVE